MVKGKGDFSKLLRLWLPVLLWCLVIFLFSSKPTGKAAEIDWQDFAIKKLAHVVFYGFLTILTFRGFTGYGMKIVPAGIFAIFFASFYGMTDEFHQSFTPGREPRFRDIGFDTIGGLLALFFLWNILPKAPKKLLNLAKKLELT